MLRETQSWVKSKAGSCVRREQSQIHKQEMVKIDSPKEKAGFKQPKPILKHLRSRGEINTGSNTASVCPEKERAPFPKMILGVFRGIQYHSKFKGSRLFIRLFRFVFQLFRGTHHSPDTHNTPGSLQDRGWLVEGLILFMFRTSPVQSCRQEANPALLFGPKAGSSRKT